MNKVLQDAGHQEGEQLCIPRGVRLEMDMYSYANMSTYPFFRLIRYWKEN